MRRLMLLRHAKAELFDPPARDHERPLTSRGREAAKKIGAYMTRHGLEPDLVLCSTAKRARETLELAADSFTRSPRIVFDPVIYQGDAPELLNLVRRTGGKIHSLLLVGHNPSMQAFAELLVASGDVDTRQRLLEKFPTGGLAVIDVPLDDWAKIHPHSGRLDRFVTPRLLETATD